MKKQKPKQKPKAARQLRNTALNPTDIGAASPKRFPEHAKLAKVKDAAQAIGEFIDWLQSEGRCIAEQHQHTDDCPAAGVGTFGRGCGMFDGVWYPWRPPGCGDAIRAALSLYFGIDLERLESEKQQMVNELRWATGVAR